MNLAQTQNRICQLEDMRNDTLNEIQQIEDFGVPCELYFMYCDRLEDIDAEIYECYEKMPPYLGASTVAQCPEFDMIPW